ncbi:MAG TPA: SigE family RNA polymerase sigma factor [Mycobacteriales bacterium]|nr:SigE family RNA polymerase sigma factor [Mycobacteriales bacterium]
MVTTERDEEFRAYVVARRAPLVRTATFLACGDHHAAEDLVQTALMKMYVAWPRVRRETADAYARKALVNASIDSRRKGWSRHEHSRSELPDVVALDPPVPSDTEGTVFAALAALPARMRAAVILRHLCELSVTETAEALGCSEGTVKSQTSRALDQLRESLRAAGLPLGSARSIDEPATARTS